MFMERISFQRSSKVHGLEMLWLKGSLLGGDVLHQPQRGLWDGEAGAGSAKAKLAILRTWMDVTGIRNAGAEKAKMSMSCLTYLWRDSGLVWSG